MNLYLTTPIYYASGSPHLGHAYTTLLADCYKRYRQLQADDVLLASGTDEHGQKIERTAQKLGVSPQTLVDEKSLEFSSLWKSIDVSIDSFRRTTETSHKKVVIEFWHRLKDANDIYAGEYTGNYCVECEQYFTTGDRCDIHNLPLEPVTENCWYFRLSRYQNLLIDHINSNPDFIVPRQRRNEALAFLTNTTLKDLCISRSTVSWGIPVPSEPSQVLYVWIDALVTYLSALPGPLNIAEFTDTVEDDTRFLDDASVRSRLENTTHFLGKDILLFHAIYWPALLSSAKLPLPRQLVVNGWLTVNGEKIAKSNPETIVDPKEIAKDYGIDGLKYYFLRSVGLGLDSNFDREVLKQQLNADLANNLGNLVSRVSNLVVKFFPEGLSNIPNSLQKESRELQDKLITAKKSSEDAYKTFNIAKAAQIFIETSSATNAYLQQQEPWKVEKENRRAEIIWVSCSAILDISILATPIVPQLAAQIRECFGIKVPATWQQLGQQHKTFNVKTQINLYPRR